MRPEQSNPRLAATLLHQNHQIKVQLEFGPSSYFEIEPPASQPIVVAPENWQISGKGFLSKADLLLCSLDPATLATARYLCLRITEHPVQGKCTCGCWLVPIIVTSTESEELSAEVNFEFSQIGVARYCHANDDTPLSGEEQSG